MNRHGMLWLVGAIVALSLFVVSLGRADAADVPDPFSAPTTIAGDTDVKTFGSFRYGYNWANSTQTVNGVTFTGTNVATGAVGGGNMTMGSGYTVNTTAFTSASNPFASLSAAYKAMLVGSDYGANGTANTFTLNNLVAGHQYAMQFWVNDPRPISGRYETLSSGGEASGALNYSAANVAGSPGQYTVGLFTAGSTSQTYTMTPGNSSTPPQINAIQLRDITNLGYWTGSVDGTWDAATTSNFASNLYNAALATTTFATAKAILTPNAVTFADSYWDSGVQTPVANNAVNIAAGGVSIPGGHVMFQNKNVNYTLTSSDANGISGTTAVNVLGSGRVIFAGANTYTGNTTIAAGTLQLGHIAAIPSGAGYGNVVVSGTLDLADFSPTINGLSGSGTITTSGFGLATLTLGANNQTSDYSGIFTNGSGTLALVKTGNGTITLRGSSSTFSGGATVDAGTLKIFGANNGNSTVGPGTLTIQSGAIVEANSHNTLGSTTGAQLSALVINGGTFLADQYNHINSVTMTGGTIGIRSGVSQVDGMYFRTRSGTPPSVTINAAGAAATISSKVTFYDTTAFTVDEGAAAPDLLVSGQIVGGGGLSKAGQGTMVLTGANTYSGTTTVSEGRLQIGDGGTAGSLGTGAVTNYSALVFNRSDAFTQANVIDGTGTVTKTGAGALTLSAANTYTGATNVNAGSLSISELSLTQSLSVANAAALVISGTTGATLGSLAPLTGLTVGSTPAAGGATLSLQNFVSSVSSPLIATQAFTTNAAIGGVTINVGGTFTGTGTFPLISYTEANIGGDGSGALALGTLPRNVTANLDNSVANLVNLNITAYSPTIWKGDKSTAWDVNATKNWTFGGAEDVYKDGDIVLLDDTAAGAGAVSVALNTTVTPYGVKVANPTREYTISGTGAIAGTGGLTKTGNGALTLGTANTFTGLTSISGGTVKIGHANALGATGTVSGTTVAEGAVLDLNGIALSAETLTLNGAGAGSGALLNSSANAASAAGPIVLASDTTIGGIGNTTLSGVISGAGMGLTKTGSGTLTLSAANSYTGYTTVNTGTLRLSYNNGSTGTLASSTLNINPGATVVAAVGNALGWAGGNWVRTVNIDRGVLTTEVAADNGWGLTINMTGGTARSSALGGYYSLGGGSAVNTLASDNTSTISANVRIRESNPGNVLPFNVADGAAVTDLLISGILSSTGTYGITKSGDGLMLLTTAPTYTGPTTVSAGALVLPATQSSTAFTVADSATLKIFGAAGSSFSTGTMTLGSFGASTLNLNNFGSQTLAASAPIKVSAAFTANGAATLNVAGNFTSTGVFPLISYPTGGMNGFSSLQLAVPRSITATLQDNSAGNTVDLNITGYNPLTWNGNNSNEWDVNATSNWLLSGSADKYQENDVALLNDTATGPTTVALNTIVAPSYVTVNNTAKNYTISGSGGIAGYSGLTKSGTGTLTLATANTYLGTTIVNAGTLQLGDGTTNGSVVGDIANNASLVLNNGSAQTYAGVVSGTGSLAKIGTAVFTLTGANTYTGSTVVNAGSLHVGDGSFAGSIAGASPVTIASGAKFMWDKNIGTSNVGVANSISGAGDLVLQGYNATSAIQVGVYELTGNNSAFSGKLILNRSIAWNNNTPAKVGTADIYVQDRATMAFNGGTFTNKVTIENGAAWHHNVSNADVVIGAMRLEGNNILTGDVVLNQSTGVALGDNTGANSTIGGYSAGNHVLTGVISGSGEFSMSRYTSWNGGTTQAVNIYVRGNAANTHTGRTVIDGQGGVASLLLGKNGAVAIQGGTTVQFGVTTGGQANLRMLQNEQFGTNNGGVLMDFVNVSGQWMRFDLLGTTQTVSGIKTGNATTQGSGVVQNGGLGVGSPFPATLKLNVDSSDPRYPLGGYVYNGHVRNQDNTASGALNLIKEGTGTQTLVGSVVTHTGTTTVNAGTLALQDTTAFASPIVVNADGTLNAARTVLGLAGRSPIMANSISGAGTININNAGSGLAGGWTTVNGATGSLNFSGTININSGVFSRDNTNADTITGTATVNVAAGAFFGAGRGGNSTVGALNGSGVVSTLWGGTNAGSITLGNGGGSGTFTGVISGNGTNATDGTQEGGVLSLVKVGAGTQTLSGVNTYSGSTTIRGGTLALGAGGSINTTSAMTIASGAVLDVSATSGFTQATGKTLTAGRTSGTGNDIVGNYTTGGTVNVAGAGTPATLTVSGDLSLTGGGNLLLDLSSSGASGNDKIVAGGGLNVADGGNTTVTPTFNGAPVIGSAYTIMTCGGSLSGAGTFTASLPAATRVTGATFDTSSTPGSVLMTLAGETRSLTWSAASGQSWNVATTPLNWSADAEYFQNLDSVTFDDTTDGTGAVTVSLTTTVIPAAIAVNNPTRDYTISGTGGVIAGGATLTKSGAGLLQLSTANTFTGGIVVSQGSLQTGNNTAAGAGTITLGDDNTGANNVSWKWNGSGTPANNIVVANKGTGTVTIGTYSTGTSTVASGAMTLNRAVTLSDGTGDRTSFTGKISGNVGTITIAGTRITLDNPANDFVGDIVVPAGSVLQTNGVRGAIPDATNLTLNGTFKLNTSSTNETIGGLNGGGTVQNHESVGGTPTLTVGGGDQSGTFTGPINNGSGTLSFAKIGTGTQTLSGTGAFTGTTRVLGGTLAITNSAALGGSTLVWDNLGGTLDYSTLTTLTLGGLQGAQNLPLLNGTPAGIALTVGGNNANTVYSGVLSGAGASLTKTGTGTLILSGAASNTYGGVTTLSGTGQLMLSKTGGAVAIPGDIDMYATGTRAILSVALDNQFAPGAVMRFKGTGDTRLELKGTTQTLGGIDNSGITNNVYNAIQYSEFGTAIPVGVHSKLILDIPDGMSYTYGSYTGTVGAVNGVIRDYNGGVVNVEKRGLGTQSLIGNGMTYTGTTTVTQGKLVFNNTYGSGSLTVNAGAVLELNVPSTGIQDYATSTLQGGGTLLKTGPGTSRWGTQAGTFAFGAGSLIDVQAGSLDGGSSANENWASNLSSLNINSGASLTEIAYSPARFDALTGGGTLSMDAGAGSGPHDVTIGANNTAAGAYNSAGTATFSGTITQGGNLVKVGTGTQTLTGTNTYSGATTITAGTLQIGDGGTGGTLGTGNVTNNSALVFNRSDNLTVSNVISGSGSVTKLGAGTLTLSSPQTYQGPTVVRGGTLKLQWSRAPLLGDQLQYWLDASNPASVDPNSPSVNAWNDVSGKSRNFATNGATAPALVSGALNGLPVVRFDGATTRLNYAGDSPNAQTVFIVNTPRANNSGLDGIWGWLGVAGAQDVGIRLTGSMWQGRPDGGGNANDYTVGGVNGTTYVTTASKFDANTCNFGGFGTPHILTAYGNSTWNNTAIGEYLTSHGRWYQGDIAEILVYNTQLDAANRRAVEQYLATKWLGYTSMLPTGTALSVAKDAVLDLNGVDATVGSLADDGDLGGGTIKNDGTFDSRLSVVQTGNSAFSGSLTDGATNKLSLLKGGPGNLTLSGPNTYSGGTTVNGGTLEIASAESLPAGAGLTIGAGGTVVLSSGLSAGAAGAGAPPAAAAPVPEPGTIALMAAGLAGLLAAAWRRRK